MNEFTLVLFKEIKSMIRDPKILIAMIIIPVIITGAMYFIMIQSMQQAIKEAAREKGVILVLNNDKEYWSLNLTKYLEKRGYTIFEVNSRDEIINRVISNESTYGLEIPLGFSNNISSNKPGYVEVYIPLKSSSYASIFSSMKIYTLINDYSRNLSRIIVEKHGLNATYVFNPVNTSATIIYRDVSFEIQNPGLLVSMVSLTSIFYPILILILSSFLIQLTATSIAIEKEEKMLETILSLPISRFKFILAKITASVLIGLFGLAIYAGIFIWFFSAISSVPNIENEYTSGEVGIDTINLLEIVSKIYGFGEISLMIINLAIFVLFILSLSIILSLFTEDVRSAQLVTQYLIIPLVFTIFTSMFIDISTAPLLTKYVLSIIPIINVSLLPIHLFSKDIVLINVVLFSNLVYAVISIYIASKLVVTEKIFTTKLFRKFRK